MNTNPPSLIVATTTEPDPGEHEPDLRRKARERLNSVVVYVHSEDLPERVYHDILSAHPGDSGFEIVSVDTETGRCAFDRPRYWEDTPLALVTVYRPETNEAHLVRTVDAAGHASRTVLRSLLQRPSVEKLFHHAMFDLRFLGPKLAADVQCVRCTKIAAKVGGVKRKTGVKESLKPLLEHYGIVPVDHLDKSYATGDWFADALDPAQLMYAAQDTLYLDLLEESIAGDFSRSQQQLYHRLSDALPVMAQAEVAGLSPVDLLTY